MSEEDINDKMNYNEYPYATLGRRVLATSLDSIIIISFMLLVGTFVQSVSDEVNVIKIILFFAPVFLYNPVMISAFGNTIFQKILKIKVVTEEGQYCKFHIAFLRWIMEVLLGWLSLIYFVFNDKHQTLHDKIAGTFVYYVKEKTELDDNYSELENSKPEYIYPSAGQRFLIFLAWFFTFWIMFWIILYIIIDAIFMFSDFDYDSKPFDLFLSIIFFLSFIGFAVLAAKGQLPGAFRRKNELNEDELNVDEEIVNTLENKIEYKLPTTKKRILFFFIWLIPSHFILGFFVGIIFLLLGMNLESKSFNIAYVFSNLFLFIALAILAAKGLLPGAMRREIDDEIDDER